MLLIESEISRYRCLFGMLGKDAGSINGITICKKVQQIARNKQANMQGSITYLSQLYWCQRRVLCISHIALRVQDNELHSLHIEVEPKIAFCSE